MRSQSPNKKRLSIGLVQISEQVEDAYYFPYSIACLQAYVEEKAPGQFHFLPIVYQRLSPHQGLMALAGADCVAFSVYIWNIQRSLALAKAIKDFSPRCFVLMGGPQVPDEAQTFLKQHPYIDLVAHGPGEGTFLAVLEQLKAGIERPGTELPGVSYFHQGQFYTHRQAPREPIETLPSPYLAGVFEPLLKRAVHSWKGVWETNRGCPFSCSFCDWGSATGAKVLRFPEARIAAEADWFGQQQIKTIYLCDANFGLLPRDIDLSHLIVARARHWGYPRQIMTQSAKNAADRVITIHQILARAGLQTLAAISFQTLTPQVLTAIRRDNISLQAFTKIQQACHLDGIKTYTDLILGLPEESYDSFAQTLNDVIEGGQFNFLQFYQAAVLPNAELAQPAYREQYGLECVEIPFPSHPRLSDGIEERLPIVIHSKAMPRTENIRAHVLAWSTLFWMHKHKHLQIVLMLLRFFTGRSWLFWLETLIEADSERFPRLAACRDFFQRSARALHQGSIQSQLNSNKLNLKPGVMVSPETSLQLVWVLEGEHTDLYFEAYTCLQSKLEQENIGLEPQLLESAFAFNQELFISKLHHIYPFVTQRPQSQKLIYDFEAFYLSFVTGQVTRLRKTEKTLQPADWQNLRI